MRFLVGVVMGVALGFAVVATVTGDSGPAVVAQLRARRGGSGPAAGASD